MLAKRGARDGLVVKIRVDNLIGGSSKWHDIGYGPILTHSPRHSREQIRESRLQLFHRLIYTIISGILDPSCYQNTPSEDLHLNPRLLSICADQPQEREFFS